MLVFCSGGSPKNILRISLRVTLLILELLAVTRTPPELLAKLLLIEKVHSSSAMISS